MNRLQPKYTIAEPSNSEIFPHTKWPSEDYYFEVWHVEVYETQWASWKKWLPFGSFRGSSIVQYRVHGHEPPSEEELRNHHNAMQPYIRSIEKDYHDSNKIKVIYESVDPSNISSFVKQFQILIRDATFYQLNPEANLQYEFVKDEDGNMYVRLFDKNASDSMKEPES